MLSDEQRQTMTPRERWEYDKEHTRALWAGRSFRCADTGDEVVIGDDVMPKDFYVVGNGFIDVGDGYYSRSGGNVYEITDDAVSAREEAKSCLGFSETHGSKSE